MPDAPMPAIAATRRVGPLMRDAAAILVILLAAAVFRSTSFVPAASFAPFAGLVMIERTGIDSRMRKFFGSPLSPGIIGLIGTR